MSLTKYNPNIKNKENRRYLYSMNSITINYIHQKNPWVVVWWSLAFPGFGHLLINSNVIGFSLIIWELLINNQANLNQAIYLSMIGDFEEAKNVLNKKWFLFYIGMYIFAAWDCYKRTVKINQLCTLAYRQTHHDFVPFFMSPIELNFLERRTPWAALFWTALIPGVGHLTNRSIPTGMFAILWWVVLVYFSHTLEAIHFTSVGQFEEATRILQPQWLLFIPSFYGFILYDTYVNTVENNKLFKLEQSRFFKASYQKYTSKFPV